MERLFCYVDETGQDTRGKLFLVCVVISEQSIRDDIERRLLDAEQQSGKRITKWQKATFNRRVAYLDAVLDIRQLRHSLFYAVYSGTKEYIHLTTYTIAKAVSMKSHGAYQTTIFIDGLNNKERDRVKRGLRQLGVIYRLVRGLRDETSPLIRLADAIAGFLRDHEEGEVYTQEFYQRLIRHQLPRKVQ